VKKILFLIILAFAAPAFSKTGISPDDMTGADLKPEDMAASLSAPRPPEVKYDKTDFDRDMKGAEGGDVNSMFSLAVAYANGYGVEQSYPKAMKWYEKAADKGDAAAKYRLGAMNAIGQGTKKNLDKAAEWFTKAAETGDFKSSLILYSMYSGWKEVRKDDSLAFKWLKNAVAADADKQPNWAFLLGVMYYRGQGTKKSYGWAKRYFEYASSKGDPRGDIMLGTMYKNGEGVEKNLDKAAAYYTKAVESGRVGGFPVLISRVYRDKGDYVSSLQWLLIAYQDMSDDEIFSLRNEDMFLTDHTTPEQKEQARAAAKKWLEEFKPKTK